MLASLCPLSEMSVLSTAKKMRCAELELFYARPSPRSQGCFPALLPTTLVALSLHVCRELVSGCVERNAPSAPGLHIGPTDGFLNVLQDRSLVVSGRNQNFKVRKGFGDQVDFGSWWNPQLARVTPLLARLYSWRSVPSASRRGYSRHDGLMAPSRRDEKVRWLP